MATRILQGDARARLAELPAASVQLVVTSPPYFGLRSYNCEPQVWDAPAEPCEHVWGEALPPHHPGQAPQTNTGRPLACQEGQNASTGQFCQRGGCWRGELGLEPTVEAYVRHLVEVFAAVRRVLRDDGVLAINLGDSYAGGAGGRGDGNSYIDHGDGRPPDKPSQKHSGERIRRGKESLPPGSLMGVPWRCAFALQADGWRLRSAIALIKQSPMPESVAGVRWQRCKVKVKASARRDEPADYIRPGHNQHHGNTGVNNARAEELAEWADCPGCKHCQDNDGLVLRWGSGRPTSAYEMLFVFAASSRYFWNSEAVRLPQSASTHQRWGDDPYSKKRPDGLPNFTPLNGGNSCGVPPAGANARNWMLWRPQALADAHYAAYPRFIPEFAIKAATPERCCGACGAPWAPVVDGKTIREQCAEQGYTAEGGERNPIIRDQGMRNHALSVSHSGPQVPLRTVLTHRPTCTCQAEPKPSTVLDIFGGSGTTALAAERLGRDCVLIDLQPDYVQIAERRAQQDAGLFGEVTVEELLPEANGRSDLAQLAWEW